jgi:hypothetical protein
MGKSRRKIGIWKDNNRAGSAKHCKKIANRKLRRSQKMSKSGVEKMGRSAYKKVTRMTWDIHDYRQLETEEQARQWYRNHVNDTTYYSWMQEEFENEDDYIKNFYYKQAVNK